MKNKKKPLYTTAAFSCFSIRLQLQSILNMNMNMNMNTNTNTYRSVTLSQLQQLPRQ